MNFRCSLSYIVKLYLQSQLCVIRWYLYKWITLMWKPILIEKISTENNFLRRLFWVKSDDFSVVAAKHIDLFPACGRPPLLLPSAEILKSCRSDDPFMHYSVTLYFSLLWIACSEFHFQIQEICYYANCLIILITLLDRQSFQITSFSSWYNGT